MAHYSINNIIQEVPSDNNFLGTKEIQSTPERTGLPIFITKNQLLEKYDTVIVGAGVAGLYAAYKITKAKPSEKILIVEQSQRTGGRLDTDLFSINGNLIKEEEGGMRFTFEDMPQLMNLFVELGLENDIVPFPMHLNDNNRRSFRGRTFSAKESGRNNYKVWSDLYGLKNGEKGIDPSSIIPDMVYPNIINSEYIIDEKTKETENAKAKITLDKLKKEHEKYLRGENYEPSIEGIEVSAPGIWQFFRLNFKWKGIELYKWTLWSLLADMGYSNECIQMMARVSGFNGTYFSTMNAGEAFQLLMEFPAEPDFKSLRYGFSQLTNALVDELYKKDSNGQKRLCNVDILLEIKALYLNLSEQSIDISDLTAEQVYEYIINVIKSITIHSSDSKKNIDEILKIYKDDKQIYLVNLECLRDSYSDSKPGERDLYKTIKSLIDYYLYFINDELKNSNNKKEKINGENIILALPRVALEKLINASKLDSSKDETIKVDENLLWSNLESTTNQPLAKINLYYENAWWSSDVTPNADVTFGPNFTDLPLGSVYPFYSDDEEVTKAAAKLQALKVQISKQENGAKEPQKVELIKLEDDLKAKMKDLYAKPAALTIYCDYQNINFWQGFARTLSENNTYPQENDNVRQIRDLKVYLKNPKDKNNLIDLSKEYITPASKQMVSAITEYFQQLFQTNKVPNPIATSVRIWEGSQSLKTDAYGNFGYGVHQWGVGAKDNEVISYMVNPFGDLPIYTCGEAYSDFQGWVEGSLRSTNLVLEQMDIPTNFTNSSYKNNKELLQYLRAEYINKFKIPKDEN